MTGGNRKNVAKAKTDENNNPNDELNLKVENLQKSVSEIGRKQEETDKKIEKILEKLEKSEQIEDSETDKKPSFNSVISPGYLMNNTPRNGMPCVGKSFVMRNVSERVSKLKENRGYAIKEEDHFGVPWIMYIYKKGKYLAFFWECNKSLETGKWAIDTNYTLKIFGINGKMIAHDRHLVIGNVDENNKCKGGGHDQIISLEEMEKDYLVDDTLTVEVHLKINKMTGVYKENLRNFDVPTKELFYVTLKIDDKTFYVSKLLLSLHSSYFRTLFRFKESKKCRSELTGIAPEDFQKYLESLYGNPSIDDTTVEGILLVTVMYDSSTVVRKCEKFLIEESEKSNEKKLQLAIRYKLDKLKAKSMSEINTGADLKSMFSGNIEDLDPSIMAELLKKAISLL